MENYSILYFRGHELVESVEMEEGDLLDAIEQASRGSNGRRAEIWSAQGRVGEFGNRLLGLDDV